MRELSRRGSLACWTVSLAVLPGLAGCAHDTVELAGVVERTNLELAAPVSQRIVELPHAEGDRVAAGDVVVRLDDKVAALELEATSALHQAAQANLSAAEQEFSRSEGLRRSGVSTPQELDRARRARDEAVALVAERAARAAQAQDALDDLTIRSTTAGVVDQLPYDVGERVPAGGVVAVVLADGKPWVRVWLPARVVSRLAPGAPARVDVVGLEGTLHGHVLDVAREPEYTPHFALTERERGHLVYEARVELEDAPPDLRPGLGATVRLSTTGHDGG